jgi:hypothetical protein
MSDVLHRIHQDWSERTTTFEVVQDVEPYLERNKELRKQPQKSDWGRHVASVPVVVINRWLKEEWDRGNTGLHLGSEEWNRLVWNKLNDPDWAYLRVD